MDPEGLKTLERMKTTWPEKFASEEELFRNIHAADRIFMGTGCDEPQHLVQALVNYVRRNPKAFFDTELIHVWTLGVAPYTNEKLQENFHLTRSSWETAPGTQ